MKWKRSNRRRRRNDRPFPSPLPEQTAFVKEWQKKNAKNVNLWLTKEREDDRIIFVAGTTGGERNQIYQPLSFRKKPIKKIWQVFILRIILINLMKMMKRMMIKKIYNKV